MQYDHMLNGRGSRQHHQDMIRQAQYNHLANKAKAAQKRDKTSFSVRNLITTLITMLTG